MNILKNKHIYLFDLDGTLIDSSPEIIKTYNTVFNKNNIKPIREVSEDIIGPTLKDTISNLIPSKHLSNIDKIIKDFIGLYDNKFCTESSLYDGVYETLDKLSKKNRLILITNKRFIPTEKILYSNEIINFFEKYFSVDIKSQYSFNKSSLIKNVLEEMKLDPKKTVYVGDTKEDFKASMDNNIDFIFAEYGYGKSEKNFLNKISDICELNSLS